uniref:Glyoxylate reductase/hydroxypyruvate reductase n=1 Tax=Amphilophus citrinellus TaxID=61819 RepID=A0A3Q0T8Y1_AMPCI
MRGETSARNLKSRHLFSSSRGRSEPLLFQLQPHIVLETLWNTAFSCFLLGHCCLRSDTLLLLPSLKVVASGGMGTDHLDVPFINSLGVKVANTPGVVSDSTADLAMGLLLASARKILEGEIEHSTDPKTVHIPQHLMGVEVTGATLGIIGMGDIGYKIAQRSKGFDMKILSTEDEQAVGASYCENLDDLLRCSDFVMIAVSLTSETSDLIGHRELSLMKPTATLINISRGQVVNQDALVEALQLGIIRAAALDVTHPEPLPRDHPLLELPNVLITPHIGISTYNTARGIVKKMVENALAAVKGLPVPNEVKPH